MSSVELSSTAPVQAEPVRLPANYKKQRWAGLAAFAFATVSDSMEGGLVNTLFPVIMKALNLDLGALGVLSSIRMWARMIFGPIWSMVADRIGRKGVLIMMTGVWGLWTAIAGLAQNYTQFLILYSIGVLGTVAAEPIQNGMLTDMFEDDERGKAFGTLRGISSLAGLFLTPVIGNFANIENGWRYGLFLMGGLSLLTGIAMLIFVKEPPTRAFSKAEAAANKFQFKDIGTILKTPTVPLIMGQLILVTSLVLFSFMVTYFVQVRGWTTPQGALLYTVFMAGFGVSSMVGGWIGDQFDKKFGPKGRVMLMQIYLVSFAAATYAMLQIDWGKSFVFYIVCFVAGLIGSIGFSGCVLPMMSAVVEPKYGATAFALTFSFVQGGLSAITMLLVGPLSKLLGGLPQVMLYVVTVPYLINAVYWFLFYRVFPRDVANTQARIAASQKI